MLGQARESGRVLVSADSDFGTILAATRAERPSVVYVRRIRGRRAAEVTSLLLDNLALIEEPLNQGSLVVLGDGTARIRRLPLL